MFKSTLKQRGDTIVEVLFAITVLAVVISGAYAISNRAIKSSRLNNERTAALKLAESQVERLREATSNQTLFSNAAILGKSSTTKYCLVKTATGDDMVAVDNQNKCVIDGRYTVTLSYNDTNSFFTSRVDWDNEPGATDAKSVEVLYRVYGDSVQTSVVGQAGLNAAIASAQALIPFQSNYSAASWAALQAALALPETTAAQITAKAIAINNALDGLQPAADLSAYNAAIAAVNQANYTSSSWAAYQAVVAANIVNSQNTQAQVDAATQNIKNAQANLASTANNCSSSGRIVYSGNYKIHIFDTPGAGSFVNNCNLTNVEILLVGGGGSSADTLCVASDWGGGAGGGYVTGTTTLSKTTYNFIVGAGGTGGGGGSNGAATTFNGYTASGGGKGSCNSGGSLGASNGAGMTVNGAYLGGIYDGQQGGGGAGSAGNAIATPSITPTYHWAAGYYTDVAACPAGWNLEFYGWTYACSLYQNDPTPSGYFAYNGRWVQVTGGNAANGGPGYTSVITGAAVTYGAGGPGGHIATGTSGVNGLGNGGSGSARNGGGGALIIRYDYTVPPVTPPPTLAGNGVGQYTITNYNAGYSYNVSASSGASVRNGNTVSCTGTTSTCTIAAVSGGNPSVVASYQRSPYTYYQAPVYGYGQIDWGYDWGCSCGGKCGNWPNGDPYCQYAIYGYGAIIGYSSVKNGTPPGWTDSGSDWYRIF